jgi:hypothetical protein
VTVRAILIALALCAAAAAPASAAEVSLRVTPSAGVRLGSSIAVSGRVTENGAPLAARTVRLEVRRHPFTGRWKRKATRSTDPDGRYAFAPRLKRNHQVRVRLEGLPPTDYTSAQPDTLSRRRYAYVLPAFTLAFAQRGAHSIRITQTYTVPKDVRLTAPTRFYVGPCKPDARDRCTVKRAPFRAKAKTRRVRAGRYVARAVVRIPASYGGRFSYVSCFAYSKGSGMGDPDLRCPRKSIRLDR